MCFTSSRCEDNLHRSAWPPTPPTPPTPSTPHHTPRHSPFACACLRTHPRLYPPSSTRGFILRFRAQVHRLLSTTYTRSNDEQALVGERTVLLERLRHRDAFGFTPAERVRQAFVLCAQTQREWRDEFSATFQHLVTAELLLDAPRSLPALAALVRDFHSACRHNECLGTTLAQCPTPSAAADPPPSISRYNTRDLMRASLESPSFEASASPQATLIQPLFEAMGAVVASYDGAGPNGVAASREGTAPMHIVASLVLGMLQALVLTDPKNERANVKAGACHKLLARLICPVIEQRLDANKHPMQPELRAALLSARSSEPYQGDSLLIWAARSGNDAIVRSLLKALTPDELEPIGHSSVGGALRKSALRVAMEAGPSAPRYECVEVLLSKDLDFEFKTEWAISTPAGHVLGARGTPPAPVIGDGQHADAAADHEPNWDELLLALKKRVHREADLDGQTVRSGGCEYFIKGVSGRFAKRTRPSATCEGRPVVLQFFIDEAAWRTAQALHEQLSDSWGRVKEPFAPKLIEPKAFEMPTSGTLAYGRKYVLVLEEGIADVPLARQQYDEGGLDSSAQVAEDDGADNVIDKAQVVSRLLRCVSALHAMGTATLFLHARALAPSVTEAGADSGGGGAASTDEEGDQRSAPVHTDLRPSSFEVFANKTGMTRRLVDYEPCQPEGLVTSRPLAHLQPGYVPAYCSPEVAKVVAGIDGHPTVEITRAIDVWALGLIAYEVYAGEPLLRGCYTPTAAVTSPQRASPRPPRTPRTFGGQAATATEAATAEQWFAQWSQEECDAYVQWLAHDGAAKLREKLLANPKFLPPDTLKLIMRMLAVDPLERDSLPELLRTRDPPLPPQPLATCPPLGGSLIQNTGCIRSPRLLASSFHLPPYPRGPSCARLVCCLSVPHASRAATLCSCARRQSRRASSRPRAPRPGSRCSASSSTRRASDHFGKTIIATFGTRSAAAFSASGVGCPHI